MPAGTWNLPDIKKTVPLRNIAQVQGITIFDQTPTSDNYFNIVNFPERLTSGKNLFKLNAAVNTLVDGSEVNIEILDFNGNPIYFEPLNYLEQDGTRVIAVYIYPDTSPGLATVYITGRALYNVFDDPILRNPLPFRQTEGGNNFLLYKNHPNLLWTRTINVAPEKGNTSEIIFTQQPRVTVVERVVNYQQPITLNNVNVVKTAAGGSVKLESIPNQGANISAQNINTVYQSSRGGGSSTTPGAVTQEGGTSLSSLPFSTAGGGMISINQILQNAPAGLNVSNNASVINHIQNQQVGGLAQLPAFNNVPVSQTSHGVSFLTGTSRAIFTDFELSASMEGGTIIIKNPMLPVQLGTALSGSLAIAVGDIQDVLNRDISTYPPDLLSADMTDPDKPGVALSGSVALLITEVESTSTAKVSQIAGPGHNAPVAAPFNMTLARSIDGATNSDGTLRNPEAYDIQTINTSTEFTSSHTEPLVFAITPQSQSFAEVVLSNIEPATGDIHRIRTSYKPLGQFGDFVSGGETVLERLELLEDSSSFEGTVAIGQIYNRMGYFTNLSDFDAYFEQITGSDIGSLAPEFSPSILMNGIYLKSQASIPPKEGFGIQLKDSYLPEVKKNSVYSIRFRLKCVSGLSSANVATYGNDINPINIDKPRFDVYISGSNGRGSIISDTNNYTSYRSSTYDISETNIGSFEDDGILGKFVGTVEMEPSTLVFNSIRDVLFRFSSAEDQNIKVSLVQRAGDFSVKDIGISTDAETGFSPNHARINIRIPSEFIDAPMAFKFEFFDFLGTKADTDVEVFPIKFTGDNEVIAGTNNIITGSVFIGNTIGSGIELAGVSSGFIRSVGYEGFITASEQNGPGGFILYTGSVLPDSGDNYTGVGFEIIQDSGSFLRFATGENVSNKPASLEVRTPRFYFGGDDNFISGSDGKIEISSSNFHLSNAGDVVMQGVITAEAGGTIGGFAITTNAISSSNDSLILRGDSGQITASSMLMDGGRITSGVTIEGTLSANSILTPATINGSPATIQNASSSIDAGGFARFVSASIGGWDITTSSIQLINASGKGIKLEPGASTQTIEVREDDNNRIQIYHTTGTNWGILGTQGGNNIFALGDPNGNGNKIASWKFNDKRLSSFTTATADKFGISLDADYQLITIHGDSGEGKNNVGDNDRDNVRIAIGQLEGSQFGIKGWQTDGSRIFELSSVRNEIAGWTFDNEKLVGGNMIIRQDGTIESDGFASNVAGSGFRLTAAQGGFLEVENARIRGTLATTTFEKETVNAVGGQLYVANSTTLTSSAVAPQGIHSASMSTMSVANVTGFAVNEIITAKKISNTGFATEYMLIESASRTDASSETNFAGLLFVRRGYSGSSSTTSGSVGDIASTSQTYSGSQVIVSTGKIGTGYIRLNANPNDPTTPYIDIVERTGSAIYDVDLKARLGDLSGVADSVGGRDVSGFGLYTDNAFLKGGIVATYGQIGGFGISATTISSSNNNLILASDGTITASDARLTGHISASSGEIGGWTIGGGKLGSNAIAPNVYRAELDGTNLSLSFNNSTFGSTGIQLQYNSGTPRFFAGTAGNHVKFDGSKLLIASDNFDIDASGNVDMTGTVTATAGAIGGFSIDSATISSSNNNIILRSTGEITASDILISGGTIAEGISIGGIPGPGQVVYFDDFTTYASTTDVTSSSGTIGSHTPTFTGDGHVANGTGVGYHVYANNNPESVIIKSGSSNTFNGNGCVLSIGNNDDEVTDMMWAISMNMIPINSASLYEFEIRLRKPGFSGGTDGQYAGVVLFESDGTTKVSSTGGNSYGSAHYVALSNASIGTSFETHKGYLKGFGNTDGTPHTNKLAPSVFESGGEGGFFAPIFIVNYNNQEGTVEIDYIKVTEFAQGGGSTRLTGDSVTTGKLRSVNLNDSSGSEINLNDGTIKFGGLVNPSFAVDTSGNVTASNALFEGEVIAGNLTERYIIVSDDNSGSYLRYISGDATTGKKNLVFDGSLGGDITSNMEISTSAAFEISDVELAFTGSELAKADVFIATEGMTFDEATVAKSTKSLLSSFSAGLRTS